MSLLMTFCEGEYTRSWIRGVKLINTRAKVGCSWNNQPVMELLIAALSIQLLIWRVSAHFEIVINFNLPSL